MRCAQGATQFVRSETALVPGKSAGTACVTRPVAAHSVPRCSVTMNPTQAMGP
jgi:hypothetical protein